MQALADRVAGGADPERPGVVHRLDRDTSGLLVLARSEAAHAALSAALREREITREYLALVDGRPPARTGTIDAPLGRDRRVRTRVSTDSDEPREAITHFEIERALPAATLLRVALETGRTHQIRAHFKAIGHPVLGDPEYGLPGRYGLARQFLHATRLAFAHPLEPGRRVDVVAPLPDDLERALLAAAAGQSTSPLRSVPSRSGCSSPTTSRWSAMGCGRFSSGPTASRWSARRPMGRRRSPPWRGRRPTSC